MSLSTLPVLLAALLLAAVPITAVAQPEMSSETGEGPGDEGDMGPFHRPAPEHNPDAERLTTPGTPGHAEIADALVAALGVEPDAAEEATELLIALQERLSGRGQSSASAEAAQVEVIELIGSEGAQSLQRLVAGLERYGSMLRELLAKRDAGEVGPIAASFAVRRLENEAASRLRTAYGDRGDAFAVHLSEATRAIAAGRETPDILPHLAPLYGLEGDDADAFVTALRALHAGAQSDDSGEQMEDEGARQQLEQQLAELIGVEKLRRLGRIYQVAKGFKSAVRDLRAVAGQQGVTREDLMEQFHAIDTATREQFRDLVEPGAWDHFISVWERAIAAAAERGE